jgi:hypothetical protein
MQSSIAAIPFSGSEIAASVWKQELMRPSIFRADDGRNVTIGKSGGGIYQNTGKSDLLPSCPQNNIWWHSVMALNGHSKMVGQWEPGIYIDVMSGEPYCLHG